jgi:hypothetical protein
MQPFRLLFLVGALLGSGCSLYYDVVPIDRDMAGCVPSPSCYLDGGADMPVVLDGGDDGMCTMMCPGEDMMGPDMARECVSSMTCPESRPVCSASGMCAPCAATNDAGTSSECAMYHAPRRLCGPAGACVACFHRDHCEPFNQTCNLATGECAPCQKHSDCTTGVCKPGGACASSAEVAYVNKNIPCSDTRSTPSTPTDPYCQIQAAATSVSPSPRPYIVVAGSATPYGAVNLTAVASPIGPLTIVGPGRGVTPAAKVEPLGALVATPAVLVSTNGSAATVTLDGLELTGTSGGIPAPGARCLAGVGAASLTIRNSLVRNSGGVGVDSSGCTLVVDANEIGPMNGGGGVLFASGPSYTITNNIIHDNNGTSAFGVRLDASPAGSAFAFNTVVANGPTGNTAARGIVCNNDDATIRASIVVLNNRSSATGTQFGGGATCVLQGVVVGDDSATGAGIINLMPVFESATNYRLKLNDAANVGPSGCCVDKLGAPSPAPPNLDHDVDRSARPKGAGAKSYDIGAHEAQ